MYYLPQQFKYTLVLSLVFLALSCSHDNKYNKIHTQSMEQLENTTEKMQQAPISIFIKDSTLIEDQLAYYNDLFTKYSEIDSNKLSDDILKSSVSAMTLAQKEHENWSKYLSSYSAWNILHLLQNNSLSTQDNEWAYVPAYYALAKSKVDPQKATDPKDFQLAIHLHLEVLRHIKDIQEADDSPVWEQNRLAVKDYIAWCKSQEFEFYDKVIEEAGDRAH